MSSDEFKIDPQLENTELRAKLRELQLSIGAALKEAEDTTDPKVKKLNREVGYMKDRIDDLEHDLVDAFTFLFIGVMTMLFILIIVQAANRQRRRMAYPANVHYVTERY